MKKLFGFITTFILTFSLALPAFAAVVSMEFHLSDAQQAKFQNDVNRLTVSKVLEDNNYYYLLLNSVDRYGAIAVAKVEKLSNAMTIYSVYSESAMKGYTIEDFTINPQGDIWLHLKGDNSRFVIIHSNSVSEFTEFTANHALLGDNCGIWVNEGIVHIWNGSTISNFALPLQGKGIADIAWHEGALFYLDRAGDIHKIRQDTYSHFSSISEIFPIEKFTLEHASLISCGGKLWLSAAISSFSDDENQSYKINYSGLVDVSANTIVALEGQADTIKYAAANGDGSMYFLMSTIFPIKPNPLPFGAEEYGYWVTITSADEVNVVPVLDSRIEKPNRRYLAQDGTLWRFGAEPGIIVTKPGGSEVFYVPAGTLPPNDITVVFNGTKVGFDASPYIENSYTMVPVRGISSLLGVQTNWNAEDKSITFTGNGLTVSLIIGQMTANVNGEDINLGVAAEIQNGRTMVPLRFISEVFDAGITWNNEKRTITIAKCAGLPGSNQEGYGRVEYRSPCLAYYETTLEGLEFRASNIVKGVLEDDSRTVYSTRNRSAPQPMYSAVTLEILEVIKGDLKMGDRITIIEPFYIEDCVLVTSSNYLPSKPNQEYFFYLGNQITDLGPEGYEGAHFIIHGERGRYLVPSDEKLSVQEYSRKDLSLGGQDNGLYLELYQEVVNAYMK